jgi:23S rRNA (uracil1939-C5)-methyltransferase
MEHTVDIKKVVAGGKGLARLANGQVALVAGVLPDETVTIRATRQHKGFVEAEVVRIDQASPDRTPAPCPYYGRCGGCDLQHASYPAQLKIKKQILSESLQRAHLPLPQVFLSTLPSPLPFAYRSRVRLHLDATGQLGFHQATSNAVVPIRRCLLATDPINRVLGSLYESEWPTRLTGQISGIELIHNPADDRVVLVLLPIRDTTVDSTLMTQMAGMADEVVVLGMSKKPVSPPAVPLAQRFSPHGLDYRLEWDHRCFFQVNSQQNAQLIELALDFLPRHPQSYHALDLFCGIGNFSVPLALRGARVTGVEHNRRSIFWAQENSLRAGLSTTRFIAADVERQLRTFVHQQARFDCILLDPPRQGLGKAAALLAKLTPERIISVSCDPATLARDLALITAEGYQLTRLIPVDMFPQTHHIESIGLLERN